VTQAPGKDDLPRDEDLSRAWAQISLDEPPVALDEAIRAAARRAAQAGPRPTGARALSRWRVPVSVAAVLVISATITLLVAERETHVPLETQEAHEQLVAPQPMAEAEPTAEPEGVKRETGVGSAARAPAEKRRVAPAKGGTEPAPADADGALSDAPVRSDEVDGGLPAADARPADSPVRRDASAAGAAEAPRPMVKDSLELKKESTRKSTAQPNGSRAEEGARPRALAQPGRAQEPASSAPAAAPPSTAGAAAAPAPEASFSAQEEAGLEPEAWLERIVELRKAGKLEEAARSLERFRRRYPDYPLPPELAPPQ
jgi:hypothetical protein